MYTSSAIVVNSGGMEVSVIHCKIVVLCIYNVYLGLKALYNTIQPDTMLTIHNAIHNVYLGR